MLVSLQHMFGGFWGEGEWGHSQEKCPMHLRGKTSTLI